MTTGGTETPDGGRNGGQGRPGDASERWRSLVTGRLRASDVPEPGTPADRERLLAYEDEVAGSGEDDPFLARVLAALEGAGTVLDVGAGAGRFTLPLLRRGVRVTAVEPARPLAARLRSRAGRDHDGLRIIEAPWERVDPREVGAGVVICSYVLPRVPDADAFVARLDAAARRRVLVYLDAGGGRPAPPGVDDPPPPGHRDLLPVLREVGVTPVCVEQVARPRAPRARWRTVPGAVVSWPAGRGRRVR